MELLQLVTHALLEYGSLWKLAQSPLLARMHHTLLACNRLSMALRNFLHYFIFARRAIAVMQTLHLDTLPSA